MTDFGNKSKSKFLSGLSIVSIENESDDLSGRCKFNFSYFKVPQGKSGFEAWDQAKLVNFIEKLRDYGRSPLSHWMRMPVGKSGRVLSIYGGFPARSKYEKPSHVPHQARWGRFRLDGPGRLCGFVVPDSFDKKMHQSGYLFDSNTFYVVFIDDKHEFYLTKD